MRFVPVVASVTFASLLITGTAHAYPIKDRELTANALYRTGRLQPSQCPERVVKAHDVPAAKRYLTAVLNCLNTSWGAHFRRAGLPFTNAKIGFITRPRTYCGSAWGVAVARYCPREGRFLVKLDKNLMDDPSDLYLFALAAHEFGHHLQRLSGLLRGFGRQAYRNAKERDEQGRRYELQADCLGGVFIGSVWGSLKRTAKDWEALLRIQRESGDEFTKSSDHGKGRTIAAWLDRGYRAQAPSACNTWTAASSQVA